MYVCLPMAHTYNDNVLNMIVHSVADNKLAEVLYNMFFKQDNLLWLFIFILDFFGI